MSNLLKIYKPKTIPEALGMLQQPGLVPLADGVDSSADRRRQVYGFVDLSDLGLAYLRPSNGAVAIGATTTLADVAESSVLKSLSNGIIALAALQTAASVLRNQRTLLGTLMIEPDSILAVVLLALDAHATIVANHTASVALAEFLSAREHRPKGELLTEITVPMVTPRAELATVSRTPRDKPIVSVCAAATIENNFARNMRISMGGVADYAVRALAAERALERKALTDGTLEESAHLAAQGLSPRGDYRGSAEYRKAMAQVLTQRALTQLI